MCIIEGIGLIELALVVGGTAIATYLAHPDAREAVTSGITDLFDLASEEVNSTVERLRSFAKASGPKPLTSDEQEAVDHLESDLDDFLDEHPDLAEEAEKRAEGVEGIYDHVNEAEEFIRGVENDIDHLQLVRRSRTAEAQAEIDHAIEQAQAWLERMREILYGSE